MAETYGSPDGQGPGLGERVGGLLGDLLRLLGRHAELVGAEARRSMRGALLGALLLLTAVTLLLFASGLLLVATILVIARWMPAWLATTVVAAVAVIAAVILLLLARSRLRQIGFPQTRETLKEDAEWLQTLARSAER